MSINSLLTNTPILNAIATNTAVSKVTKGQVQLVTNVPAIAWAIPGAAFSTVPLNGVSGAPLAVTLTNVPIGAAICYNYNSSVTVPAGQNTSEQIIITDGTVTGNVATSVSGNPGASATYAVLSGVGTYIATTSTVTFTLQAKVSAGAATVVAGDTELAAFVV